MNIEVARLEDSLVITTAYMSTLLELYFTIYSYIYLFQILNFIQHMLL